SYWEQVYQELDAARIDTIHSLCAEILRRHPVEASLDPRFEMLEEGAMALERSRAVNAALAWAADDDDAASLFDYYSDTTLRELLRGALERSLDVEPALGAMTDDVWLVWQPVLLAPFRTFVTDSAVVEAVGCMEDALQNGVVAQALRAGYKLAPLIEQALDSWGQLTAAIEKGDLTGAAKQATLLRKAASGNTGLARNWGTSGVKESAAVLRLAYDAQLAPLVPAGSAPVDQIIATEILPAFVSVYQHALSAYRLAKVQANALDFDDLESRALALLCDHPEVLEEWRQEVVALLVDEFQDTNARQRGLVDALNGGRGRLFIVGDAKQSIYGFRGADVTVFRGKRTEISAAGASFNLSTTYRAHPGLVSAHNVLLRPVLGPAEDPERPYIEPYAGATSARDAAAAGVCEPYVEVLLAGGGRESGAPARAARALAARLVELMAAGIVVTRTHPDTGDRVTRPLDYGDVAILCRATSSFGAYEDALEEAGIRYLTISGRGFYGRPEVRDLLNALQALVDPADDLALVGMLRSPAFGVDDMTIYNLRSAQRESTLPSLWSLLEDVLSPEDSATIPDRDALLALPSSRGRLMRVRDTVLRLAPMRGRKSVADLLKAFLDATQYQAILLARGQERATRNVDKLLADASASGLFSVGELLDYVAALRDVSSREGEGRGLATGAVQIMSIHQAKGLEYPIVVIGDVCKGSRNRAQVLVDKALGLVLPPPRSGLDDDSDESDSRTGAHGSMAYHLASRRLAEREAAEADRLLYVAATRAEEMLILSGAVGITATGKLSTAGMLKRLDCALGLEAHLPAADPEGERVHEAEWSIYDETDDPVRVACRLYEPAAQVSLARTEDEPAGIASGDLPNLRLVEPLLGGAPYLDVPLQRVDLDPPQRVWRVVPRTARAYAPAWVVGQLVHRALARWSFPDDDPAFNAWSDAEARDCGLTDQQERRDALSRAFRMLRRFQATPLYAKMASAETRLGETPYSVFGSDGRVESGIIDALYRDAAGWTLVEFKTDDVRSEETLEDLLKHEDYVPQVSRYLKACRQLLPRSEDGGPVTVRPLLVFLDYRGGVREVTNRWDGV
ncbi:MAG: UvrD-helicase domain-containing protein, partial [Anaerolineae bacterium]